MDVVLSGEFWLRTEDVRVGTERSELRWAAAGVLEGAAVWSAAPVGAVEAIDKPFFWVESLLEVRLCWIEEVRVGGVGGEASSLS